MSTAVKGLRLYFTLTRHSLTAPSRPPVKSIPSFSSSRVETMHFTGPPWALIKTIMAEAARPRIAVDKLKEKLADIKILATNPPHIPIYRFLLTFQHNVS